MTTLLRVFIYHTFYPTWWFSRLMYALRIWKPWAWVDRHVLLGAVPTKHDLKRLKALGISSIINMCEEFKGYEQVIEELGLKQLRLPTLDYHVPSRELLLRGVAFLEEEVAAGHRVYVHCKAGRGRSPALVMCYLMKSRRIGAKEAFDLLRSVRPQVSRSIARYPTVLSFDESTRAGGTS